jgi:hypothetical protein
MGQGELHYGLFGEGADDFEGGAAVLEVVEGWVEGGVVV